LLARRQETTQRQSRAASRFARQPTGSSSSSSAAPLAELSGMPWLACLASCTARATPASTALYDRAGLPASAYPAFREASEAMHEDVLLGVTADAAG
jgi:hypothetical protein